MSTPVIPLVILGAGGDGLVVAEAARHAAAAGQPVRVVGFLDDGVERGRLVGGMPILDGLDEWGTLDPEIRFVPAIQKVREMPRRATRITSLGMPGERWYTLVHPTAAVARDVVLGAGVYIAACATVQPGCRVGNFASIRAGAALGHEATMEDHSYVGANATMCGKTVLSEGAHLGPNAVILDARTVGRYAVVGIGAAVTKNVSDYAVVMGNPARRVGVVRPFVPSSTAAPAMLDGEERG